MFTVINVETGANHGKYDSLELARGCVSFDRLTDWEIWDGDNYCVASGLDDSIQPDTDPENIYNTPSIKQSVEEDRR